MRRVSVTLVTHAEPKYQFTLVVPEVSRYGQKARPPSLRDPQALVYPAEIVMREAQRASGFVIVQPL